MNRLARAPTLFYLPTICIVQYTIDVFIVHGIFGIKNAMVKRIFVILLEYMIVGPDSFQLGNMYSYIHTNWARTNPVA